MTAVCYFIPGALSRGPLGQQELLRRQAYLQARTAATTRVEVHESPDGPPSIESPEDEAAAVPTVLEAVPDLDARGFDAVIVGCFGDPGVRQAQGSLCYPGYRTGSCGVCGGGPRRQRREHSALVKRDDAS